MGQTLVEKIVQNFTISQDSQTKVKSGDYVSIKPAHIMTHDNTGAVLKKFSSIGAKKVAYPEQPVFALDHNVMDKSTENLAKYEKIENFATEMGIDFYPAGRGIGHQIICEEGYAWPYTMVVASDSHSNMYGGLGALGSPIVRTDAAAIWATGQTWWKIPPSTKVSLEGKPQKGITGKDIILALCGTFKNDEVLNHAIEFSGNGIKNLSIDDRLAIANMTTEWGALVGIFPVDEVTIAWLKDRASFLKKRGFIGIPSEKNSKSQAHPRIYAERISTLEKNILSADKDAFYQNEITIDLASIQAYTSGPGNVKTMAPVSKLQKEHIKIQKAYLVSCVNSRTSDIVEASKIAKGKKFHSNVEFYLAAASKDIEEECKKNGSWNTLINAGAKTLMPGCGPCIGLGEGLLKENETGISATNRNFKGRMGHPSAKVYLASPSVVTASAIKGEISLPENLSFQDKEISSTIRTNTTSSSGNVKILDGFPEKITGALVFCHQDNLNTDGIYPGKYTYQDDITPEKQAQVAMENYDPEFSNLAKEGDILAGGYNFGTGSSREQAATALKYKGIQALISGSLSETYKRNAINNGFLVLEAPEFITMLKNKLGTTKLSIRIEDKLTIDIKNSKIHFENKTYPVSSTGEAAQEIILAGGLENWVKTRI